MVGEVKCVKEGSVRGVRAGAWGGRDGWREVQVDAHRRCLSHDVSDLALEAVEESCAFFLIVGGFYSEIALRNEKQRAQCILNTS